MGRLLYKVFLFAGIAVVLDFSIGFILDYMLDRAKGGLDARNNYICLKTHEDVLIMGSSRAAHHYNPELITQLTGLSCYNCGQDGNGIVLSYGFWKLISKRYHPKMLIYEITPSHDLLKDHDNHRYLGILKPYYYHDGIPQIFEDVDPTEKYKMMSNLYRYNSKALNVFTNFLHPVSEVGYKGFLPVDKEMDLMKISQKKDSSMREANYKFDPLKMEYFKNLIDEAGDTKLIFVVSPTWYGMDTNQFLPLVRLCQSKGVPLLDFSNSAKYVHNNKLFYDPGHLNLKGANEFTKDIIQRLPYNVVF